VVSIDLEMLAYDIADTLSRNEYPIDVDETHILPELPGFIAAIIRNAAREAIAEIT
jgi:hypothetical protein